ncbi:hypothetical protein PMAYCL1PPCAC_14598, partial [Pristionchus mayeri]
IISPRTNIDFGFTVPGLLSDATLIVKGKELHVNEQYLSNMSSVLRTMFDNISPGTRNTVVLEEVKYQECVEFLRWIYPSNVKNFEEEAIHRLIALSKRLNVP